MPNPVRAKRGTLAQISAAASVNGLNEAEIYFATDIKRFAVGTGQNSFDLLVRQSDLPENRDYGLITSSPTATEDWGGL